MGSLEAERGVTGCAGGDLSGILSPYTVGYEVVGEVVEAGSDVTKFRIGKIVRVGCVLGCCRNCRPCNTDTERYRRKKIWSYNDGYPDGQPTQGGFSGSMVVDQEFVVKIPDGMAPKQVAPHLCAVGTVYSPLNHFGLMANGLRVGILGLGGVKHMRVKIAKALEHHVTDIISSSDKEKVEALEHLAADEYLAISGTERMQTAADSLDYIIETVPVFHPFEPYLSLLNLNGKLILTGVISTPLQFVTPLVVLERKPITGNFIGSVNETDEVLQFCREEDLTSMNEVVKINYVNTAMERPEKSDVPYRVSQEGNVVSLGRKMMEKTRGYTSSFILYFDKSRTHGFAREVSNTKPITMQDENKGWVSQEGKLVSIGRKMKEKMRGYLSSLILYFDKSRTHEFTQESSITKPVTKQDENKGWFKVFLMLFLLFITGPSGVRSEDIGNPLIPGSTAMDFLLANKNLRGPSVRRQMRGTEAAAVNDNFNYPSFPHRNSPPNSPASNQANPYKRPCNPGDKCRQGKKGKKN